jgi:hypothetical protein
MLGGLLLSVFVFEALRSLRRCFAPALCLWFVLQFALTWAFHYRDDATFLRFEAASGRSPAPLLGQAFAFAQEGNLPLAFEFAERSAELIPKASISESRVALEYWQKALYFGYFISRKRDDRASSERALGEMMKFRTYYSILACLQDDRRDPGRCADAHEASRFCEQVLFASRVGLPMPDPRWLRVNLKNYCSW